VQINLLTLRICWELDFLRMSDICSANSILGKESGRCRQEGQEERTLGGQGEQGPV
jgi:hypothetical protein